jgi:hypothetical protein
MSSDSTSARALASRRNGARSRGPKTAAGRARSARNALKHGLTARRLVLLEDEDPAAFAAFQVAAQAELAPQGAFQADLVARMVTAAWRARRADRLEAALLKQFQSSRYSVGPYDREAELGLEVIRDCNGPRALDSLVRYRGAVLMELFRALGALKLLQAPAGEGQNDALPLPRLPRSKTKRTRESAARQEVDVQAARQSAA